MQHLEAVIFDLDGTLVDSNIDFLKMKRRSIALLEASGVEQGLLSEDMLNYDIENRAVQYLRSKGVTEEEIQKILGRVSEIMNEIELEALENVKLLDGVIETLERLKQMGLRLGIITRGCREYVDAILGMFGLGRLIDAVAARDAVSKPKPDPEHPRYLMRNLGVKASETLLVGDHPLDALCARNVGMRYFLIARKETHLSECKDRILQTIRDLIHVIEENLANC